MDLKFSKNSTVSVDEMIDLLQGELLINNKKYGPYLAKPEQIGKYSDTYRSLMQNRKLKIIISENKKKVDISYSNRDEIIVD